MYFSLVSFFGWFKAKWIQRISKKNWSKNILDFFQIIVIIIFFSFSFCFPQRFGMNIKIEVSGMGFAADQNYFLLK